jgi:hypothetical protein
MKYFELFTDYEQMMEEWGGGKKAPIPTEDEVLFAWYAYEDYSGDAFVLFQHDGKLYEVNGGHCSCYGLSEASYSGEQSSQWGPEETTWEALAMRKFSGMTNPAHEAIQKLIAARGQS